MRFGFREVLFVLLLLAVPVGAYLFVFEPRNKQIEEVREEIKRKQAKLEELEQATKKIPDLGEEIDRLTVAIDTIEQKLPDDRKLDELLRHVTDLATRHRLVTKSIRPAKPEPSHHYSRLPVPVEIVGDFDNFYTFLLELEKMPRIVQLQKMKLSKLPEKDREHGQMRADVELSVFFETDDSAQFGATRRGRSRL